MTRTASLLMAASETDLPAVLTLCISPSESAEGDWMVYRYCKNDEEASFIKESIQSIGGSHIEQDGNFVYCLPSGDFDDILSEIDSDGFDLEETC